MISRGLEIALLVPAFAALLSAAATAAWLWHVPPWLADGAFLLLGLALASGLRARRRAPAGDAVDRRLQIAFWAACAVALASAVTHLFRFPHGGNDAWIIWNLRARWLFRAGPGGEASAFSPEILFWSHTDYPPLLPQLIARGYQIAARESQAIPACLGLLFAAVSVAMVVAALRQTDRSRGLLGGLALVSTPAFVMAAADQLADVPLAAFVTGSVALLVTRERGDPVPLLAAGAFAGMAAWTKNEGALHLALIAFAVLLDERRLRSVLFFLSGALPFLALLVTFKLRVPPNDLLQTSANAAFHRFLDPARWWTLLRLVLRRIVLLQVWGLHLLAVLAFVLFLRRRSAPCPGCRWLSWMPAATVLAHLAILLGQPHEVAYMFRVTIDRLLVQIWPAILLLVGTRSFAQWPVRATAR
jgi:hypothetical protein